MRYVPIVLGVSVLLLSGCRDPIARTHGRIEVYFVSGRDCLPHPIEIDERLLASGKVIRREVHEDGLQRQEQIEIWAPVRVVPAEDLRLAPSTSPEDSQPGAATSDAAGR